MNSYNEGIYTTIDADTIVYLVAYKYRDSEDVDGALADLDSYVKTILDNTACTFYAGFLGGTKCFRYQVAVTKPYKGNRPESPDWYKKWSGPLKAHLCNKWNFQIVNNIEADDAVCIYQTWCRENDKNSIMCHGDKDLYQIEGNHYDIRKHTHKYVSEYDGCFNMYAQVCCGDTSDNIVGLKGCGKVGAAKILGTLSTKQEMSDAVVNAFRLKHGEYDGTILFHENFRLIYLLQHSIDLVVVWNTYTPVSAVEEPEIDLTGLIWD